MSIATAFDRSVDRLCDEYSQSNASNEVDSEKWCIQNFLNCRHSHKEFLKSQSYFAGPHKELEYCFHLYPRGDSSVPANKFLSIHPVLIKNRSDKRVRAKFEISVIDDLMKHFKQSFSVHIKARQLETLPTFPEFACLDVLKRLLFYNLNIHCTVNVSNEMEDRGFVMRHLSEDFESLFRDQKHCDVTLVVKDKKILAHRSVLASRSPVFSAMFDHDMWEHKNDVVNITDIESHVFEEFLLFLYSGRSMFLDETNFEYRAVCDLLSTANKYDVPTLKKTCADRLEDHLTVDNSCEILSVADIHDVESLKKSAIDFINANASRVVLTTGWEEMLNTSSIRLLADLYVAKVSKPIFPHQMDSNDANLRNVFDFAVWMRRN